MSREREVAVRQEPFFRTKSRSYALPRKTVISSRATGFSTLYIPCAAVIPVYRSACTYATEHLSLIRFISSPLPARPGRQFFA